ncbi:hypothetical protein [Paenibacillus montanisoli]|uniref:hypothetical protein n=1 Tax=Paenibacillus montanisoli TaxID=2081970 RepID=UPI00105794D9|nr:hypothetical protein [Paenibacillus montanisoli]
MTFIPIDRIVSLGNDGIYTSTNSANSAIINLFNDTVSQVAVEVTNPHPSWPSLDNFGEDDNPSIEFRDTTNPRYIWNKSKAQPGDTVYFAAASTPMAATNIIDLFVCITAFADDAFEVNQISLCRVTDSGDLIEIEIEDLLSTPLQDGPMTLPVSDLESPPGWQTVRYFSNIYRRGGLSPNPNHYSLVVIFKAVNYPAPANPDDNPGAIAFNIDIYKLT